MADNYNIIDGDGVERTIRAIELGAGTNTYVPTVFTTPSSKVIPQGLIANTISYSKFGTGEAVNSFRPIWPNGALSPLPTSAAVIAVSSSDANDTAAGTGLRELFIEGLDADWNIQSETVIMNGTSTVNTANTYLRVNKAYGTSWGNEIITQSNEGDITLTIGASTVAYIAAGAGQTEQCIYTVPANYTGNVQAWTISVGQGKTYIGKFYTKDNALANPGWRSRRDIVIYQSPFREDFDLPPISIGEKTDIILGGKTVSGTESIAGGFQIVLNQLG